MLCVYNVSMSVTEVKECWRCEKLKKETDFHLRYQILRNQRLNICEVCILEESQVLGETPTEIRGIYTHMQRDFKNLDKSMYKRFWLKAVS